jgi:diadenosine tetraphosphate (Ap4A) HIT family hydrolase
MTADSARVERRAGIPGHPPDHASAGRGDDDRAAEGFSHVHFHVIPRHADLDARLRGPRVFELLGGDPARTVPDAVMDEIAASIAAALPAHE